MTSRFWGASKNGLMGGFQGGGAAAAAASFTLGGVYENQTAAGHTVTASTASFPNAGLALAFVYGNSVAYDSLTIGGAAATLVAQSNTASPNHLSIWQAVIATSKTGLVATSSAGFPSSAGTSIITGVLTTTTTTNTGTAARAYGARADPQTTGTTLTCATGGLILELAYGAGQTINWQAPASSIAVGVTNVISLATATSSDDPSFTTASANAGAIAAAVWGP